MRYRKLMTLGKLLAVSLSAILVASCQTTGSSEKTINTAAFCDVAKPIWWSVKDTKKTIVQVKEHNAVGKMCGWK